ncbi:MAG TPA: hypothetical protein VF194_01920 [Ferrovibrio sp.]|jgi:hypothetical protein|uniref:hypothetical protein n=1 Tax=Ferrovibrio sp. TaxID=1917215 RepID=UPI002ED25C15
MHLKSAIAIGVACLAALTLPNTASHAQQQQQQQQKQTEAQPDPRAKQPESQPIVPPAATPAPAAKPAAEKKSAPTKKAAAAPRNRTLNFDLPPLVPIAEIPRGRAVTIQGIVASPQPTTLVLNDGNASMVVNLGPTWRELTEVKAGDRIRVIGQMDPYGAPVFRAGSVMLENNRIIVVPPNG